MPERKYVRRLRHWKQRFNRDAEFIWRRTIVYAGERYEAGTPIPEALAKSPTKLRRFWEGHSIELAEFDVPNVVTGQVEDQVPSPMGLPGVLVRSGRGSWFLVKRDAGADEIKVNGQRALDKLLDQWRTESTLLGSSVLDSVHDIGDETIPLGDVVLLAFEGSGLSRYAWNVLSDEDREDLVLQSLDWMTGQGEDEDAWMEDFEDGLDGGDVL